MQRWYKDRKGRAITNSEIDYYMQIVEVMKRTDSIMNEISTVYAKFEKEH